MPYVRCEVGGDPFRLAGPPTGLGVIPSGLVGSRHDLRPLTRNRYCRRYARHSGDSFSQNVLPLSYRVALLSAHVISTTVTFNPRAIMTTVIHQPRYYIRASVVTLTYICTNSPEDRKNTITTTNNSSSSSNPK